jgi:nicotinamidase-related amidase
VPHTALIVVDMLNPYDHEDAEPLARSVAAAVDQMAGLVERAGDDTQTVYVNDNHDDWEAGRDELVRRALDGRHPELVEPVVPPAGTPFLVKGRHSIFYETALAHVLRSRGIERIVICGQVTEQCILYSSLDAYLRGFEVAVPPDAVAHIHEDLAQAALRMMEVNMHADLAPAERCELVG